MIILPRKIPHEVAPKNRKRCSHKSLTTIDESDVPCVVCHDKNLPLLLENDTFGNKVAQDDMYYHFGTPKY